MRRLAISLSILAITGSAVFVACSSDDSTTSTNDAGATDAAPDNYVAPTDSGPSTDSGADAGCVLCGVALANGNGDLCTDNGPPSSIQLFSDFLGCWCPPLIGITDAAPPACDTDETCGPTCNNGTAPSKACTDCWASQCGAQMAACANDNGTPQATDGGKDGGKDAGDGG